MRPDKGTQPIRAIQLWNSSEVKVLWFCYLKLPEQRRIAEVLAACDRELDLLARKRDALQRQKRGLMQQLLTGRVRVKV